jgi:hypothetical protein
MGVSTSEVGYTSATTGRGDHEVHKGHVVALEKKNKNNRYFTRRPIKIFHHISLSSSQNEKYFR